MSKQAPHPERFVPINFSPPILTKTQKLQCFRFSHQTKRPQLITVNPFGHLEYESEHCKDRLLTSLHKGFVSMGKQPRRDLTKAERSIAPMSIDLSATRSTAEKPKLTKLSHQLGRDLRIYKQTDLYKNIELENTREQREEELQQRRME